jgi:NADH-quinone oxidoreductase subunit N
VTGLLAQTVQFLPHPPLNFGPVAPELILVGVALFVLLLDAFMPRVSHAAVAGLSFAGVVAAVGAAIWGWAWRGAPTVLGGMVATDHYASFFRFVLLGVAALGIMLSFVYLRRSGEYRAEYYVLLLLATAGMTLLAAAADLILVFLALELLSLALYLLTGFSFRRVASSEASMKYFLLGAFSSAFFLYGIAFAYGAVGTTSLAGLAATAGRGSTALALIAVGLLLVGFSFKVAAVPFHMWTPDAYQGAPTCVTAFMSAGTKVAAFAAMLRVLTVGFHGLTPDWRPVVAVLAGVSMVLGSLLAIAQSDVKRMLAYSSVAHAGFILVGVSAGTVAGVQAAMFYLAAYAALILGAFGVVILVSERGERRTSLASYRGLAHRSPWLAAGLTLFLLSAAGIPPTAGFMAKVLVFQAAVRAGGWPLVLVAVLASVVGAFFYLRVIALMYMRDAEEPAPVPASVLGGLALAVPAVLTLVLGAVPGVLLDLLHGASALLGTGGVGP